jgi:threonylcarbamoyladenosine tRNA methylthiotransferase MtaB
MPESFLLMFETQQNDGLSVKNVVLLWKPPGSNRTVLFESENKEGYIHGFTENYVK